jgi:predicted tellurium resistance membrane protein TerC
VRTVIVADLVMSVDNVIAIAGAAQGAGEAHQMPLVIFGLLVSVPIIVWGSTMVIKLMDRFPIVITLGGMLLGWIAGGMLVTDPAIKSFVEPHMSWLAYAAPAAGALLVLAWGRWHASRKTVHKAVEEVEDDIAEEKAQQAGKPAAKQPDGASS